MKYGFVAKHRGARPTAMVCEALGVSHGGFYAWLTGPRGRRNLDDEVIGRQTRLSFVDRDAPTVPAGSGGTCWKPVIGVGCIASSG